MAMSSTMTIDKRTGRQRRKRRMTPAQRAALNVLNRKPKTAQQINAVRRGVLRTMRTGRTKFGRRSKI